MSKLSLWRSPQYVHFMNYINVNGGIQRHRWGDSTIQANAVKMFVEHSNIVKFDFAYEHRSHGYKNYEEVSDTSGLKIKRVVK